MFGGIFSFVSSCEVIVVGADAATCTTSFSTFSPTEEVDDGIELRSLSRLLVFVGDGAIEAAAAAALQGTINGTASLTARLEDVCAFNHEFIFLVASWNVGIESPEETNL